MRAPISVVIPVLNSEAALVGCASALMEGVEAGLIREVIVSDGGSCDATQVIADEIGATWVSGPASRGGQLMRGCVAAKGEWLLILHADTQLQARWSEAVKQHLIGNAAGYFRLAFDAKGLGARYVERWANLRSRLFQLPYGDQGLLISRALYDEVGGYLDQPLMEDVAIARALWGQLIGLDAVALTSAEKYINQGWLVRGGRNLWTLARYFFGVPVETLAAAYRRP